VQAPEHAWLSVVGVFDELYATQQLSGPQVGWVVTRYCRKINNKYKYNKEKRKRTRKKELGESIDSGGWASTSYARVIGNPVESSVCQGCVSWYGEMWRVTIGAGGGGNLALECATWGSAGCSTSSSAYKHTRQAPRACAV
jgi:hypothetical protein